MTPKRTDPKPTASTPIDTEGALRAAEAFAESSALMARLSQEMAGHVADAAEMIRASLAAGGTLLCCGNGGSAADAQHIAAELGGKFYRKRPGLAAVALTVNSSMLTAIGNDFGYDEVFSRQVEALGRRGDVLLAISTSGRSANVVAAARQAQERGVQVIALTGAHGGPLGRHADLLLDVPGTDTPRIQEAHIAIGHLLCELVEAAFFPGPKPARRPAARKRR